MEGLDAKRIFARLQLEGEEFLLTSPFIELVGRFSSRTSDFAGLLPVFSERWQAEREHI